MDDELQENAEAAIDAIINNKELEVEEKLSLLNELMYRVSAGIDLLERDL